MADDSLVKTIEFFGNEISVKQDFSGELGATVWDAAVVLIKYFENLDDFPKGFFKGKRVLELGSGTGAVGIALGLLGAQVVITDQKPLLQLMEENVNLNSIKNNVQVKELNWGEDDKAELNPPFDIIVASDVIANCYSGAFPKFFQTLRTNSTPNTVILLSYEKRDIKDVEFFKLLREQFTYKKIPNEKLDPFWQSEDIGVFRIEKK